jgi:hypothetical protein
MGRTSEAGEKWDGTISQEVVEIFWKKISYNLNSSCKEERA